MNGKQHIFPTDALEFGYLSDDQIQTIFQACLVRISELSYNELFVPHEMANDVFNDLDANLFNDNELKYVRDNMFELICDMTTLFFNKGCHVGEYRLIFINGECFSIAYTERPKENY